MVEGAAITTVMVTNEPEGAQGVAYVERSAGEHQVQGDRTSGQTQDSSTLRAEKGFGAYSALQRARQSDEDEVEEEDSESEGDQDESDFEDEFDKKEGEKAKPAEQQVAELQKSEVLIPERPIARSGYIPGSQ